MRRLEGLFLNFSHFYIPKLSKGSLRRVLSRRAWALWTSPQWFSAGFVDMLPLEGGIFMNRVFFASFVLFAMLSALASAASENWQPAVVTSVTAAGDNTGFTITASGELPQPKACYDVRISKAPIVVWPPHYLVEQRATGKICTEVLAPYQTSQHFTVKPLPKSVDVYALDAARKPKHWVVPIVIETR